VNKYLGLSFFLFPMDAQGVTVRPLIKMTGEGGFNQVMLDRAPMPSDALLGQEGQGWEIAMTTLLFERGAGQGTARERAAGYLVQARKLVDAARSARRNGSAASDDAVLRDRVAASVIEAHALALSALRSDTGALSPERPSALAFMSKLTMSEYNQRLAELACDLLGPEAALWLGDEHAPWSAEWPRAFMNSFGLTIGGGTSEIQRNILGERILGLPKSK
jgi:alkylation response protein AidB-like acyl-CoA dehydrogenase